MNRNSIKLILVALTFLFGVGSRQSFAQTNVVPDDVEFQALKTIYDSLGGPNWTNKTNWPTAGSWPATATAAQMGTWYGVRVSNGDITQLSFSANNLTGQIPISVNKLQWLNYLNFANNSIIGQIPASIGQLSKLTVLYLGNNQLVGSIPAEIGNLLQLSTLYLGLNKLTGDIPNLSNLTNLTFLHLGTNLFNAGPIPTWIGNLTQLTSLQIYSVQRTGTIPSWIGNLTNLTSLYLNNNQLTGPMPSWIGNLTNLQQLNLSNNQLSGTIPSSLGNLTNLVQLLINYNALTGTIPNSIGGLTKLTAFQLAGNQLTGSIPSSIGNLTKLQNIYLFSNSLSGSIPDSFGNLTDLSVLSLNNNFGLSGTIPASIGNLTKLVSLSFSNNKLTGSIPSSLGNLINLTGLQLSNNQLSGELPSSLSGMVKIQTFSVSFNQLTGTIPAAYSNWTQLYSLDLSSNKFSGTLSDNLFSTWTKLAWFDFGYNNFTGTFPSSLSSSIVLTSLIARGNKFTSLPSSILSLPVATIINFDNNQLTSIPNFANHVNKANLSLTISNNQLDFSQLEPLIGAGIKTVTYAGQKDIADVPTISLQQDSPLVITTRPVGQFSTVTWEKLNGNGTTWTSITANDQDAVPTSFTRTTATTDDEGTYRWKMTNTKVTGMTLQSSGIAVKTAKRFAMDQWGFQYKYDSRKRMIGKKVPGADWVYMVYDKRDRLVMTQDAEQRKLNKWTFTKYDAINRPIMTGLYTHSVYLDQVGMSALISSTNYYESYSGLIADAGLHGYTNTVFPKLNDTTYPNSKVELLTVTYYDDYNSLNGDSYFGYKAHELGGQYNFENTGKSFPRVMGQVTCTKTRTLGTDIQWIRSVNYYDDKYRLVQSVSDDYRQGVQSLTNTYDFVGKVIDSKTVVTGQDIHWTNLSGVTTSKDKVKKSVLTGFSGASSIEVIPANTDGWIEYTCSEQSALLYFGLSDRDVDLADNTIDYGVIFSMFTNKTVQAYEFGATTSSAYKVDPGDVIRIERIGTVIYFKKNGIVFRQTPASAPSTSQLVADLSMATGGWAELYNPKISIGGNTQSLERTFTYDHSGRLLKTFHSLNGATPVLLVQNEYNELGQLVDKKEYSTDNGTTFKQSVDYRYNIRGWLTSINNSQLTNDQLTNDDTGDLFGMELGYNNSLTGLSNTSMYNGNISAMKWSVNQGLGTPAFGTPSERAYSFAYDPLNRLQSASHLDNNGTWATSNSFSEDNLSYDYNGNIKTLSRKGQSGSVMDILNYDYGTGNGASNQLLKVSDTGDKTKGFADGSNVDNDYTYDANGNMIIDKNKSIITSTGTAGITYNHLNLPDKVTKSTGDYIKYIYDATGRKLSQQVFNSTNTLLKKTDYVGEYFYENDTLKFINHEEGRIAVDGVWQPAPQMVPNSDATTITGFSSYGTGNITMTNETIGSETYLKVVSNQTGSTPGAITPFIDVLPGKQYSLKIKGFKGTTGNAVLYAQGTGDILWPGPPLSTGAANEDWSTTNFTVPAGIYKIRVGVLWLNTVQVGDFFYINKIEVYPYTVAHGNTVFVPTDLTYQYHLKDHLGNVRLTYTTKDDVQANTATMETANAPTEQSQFLNYSEAIEINAPIFDHTNAGPTFYSTRLTGTASERIGLAKSLSVMPGDKIDIEVFAKYLDPNNTNWTTALASFMASIATGGGAPAGTIIDGGFAGSLGNGTFPFQGLLPRTGDTGTGPKAYLNYLVFDRDYVYKTGGFKRLSTAARERGTDIAHERLSFDGTDQILIREPGYVYIWLSNENDTPVEVYFDDFKVTHTKSPVIESQDFYPFGLSFNKYSRENSLPNKLKLFQGQEHIDDLGLNWDSFKWRNHQPDIGRFFNVDPLAEKYLYNSPYAFSENKVINHRELEGLEASPINCSDCENGSGSVHKDEGADRFFKGVVSTSKEIGKTGALMSDANDATVLATSITRGGDAVNIDGSKASVSDKIFAALGAVIPALSGSAIKMGMMGMSAILVRFGNKAESVEELAKQAANAESNGFPHGVSTKKVDKLSGSDKAHKSAELSAVEQTFEVVQTGAKESHHTVVLPKPVTAEVAKDFNNLFKPK